MSYVVSFLKEAEADLTDAALWYEQQRKGLGNYFLIHVDACLALIQRHPNQFKIVYKDLRVAVLQRFPYSVYYSADENTIKVKGILHHRRNKKRILRKRK